MSTPTGSAVAYLAPIDLFAYCDLRTLADWASDNGQRVGVTGSDSNNVDPSVVGSNANVVRAMLAASGEFEAALLRGHRYEFADLLLIAGLNPDGSPASVPPPRAQQELLRRILAGLAAGVLYDRRPRKDETLFAVTAFARGKVAELAAGEAIFGLVEVQDAGVASHQVETAQDVENRQGTAVIMRPFFGRRVNQMAWPDSACRNDAD